MADKFCAWRRLFRAHILGIFAMHQRHRQHEAIPPRSRRIQNTIAARGCTTAGVLDEQAAQGAAARGLVPDLFRLWLGLCPATADGPERFLYPNAAGIKT